VLFARAAETGDPALVVPEPTDAQVPLSDAGVRQARAAGAWLARLEPADRPDVVVCSPYRRAVATWDTMAATARETGAFPAAPLVDERLRDRETGVLELMTPAAVRATVPAEAARRERLGDWFYRPPGGESQADVALRVRDFLDELRGAAAGRHVLLVTHDTVAVAIRRILAGIGAPSADAAPVANASLSTWDGDGARMRMTGFGAVGHLDGGPEPHPGGSPAPEAPRAPTSG
jgi:broad specificity phosphatase PhoE